MQAEADCSLHNTVHLCLPRSGFMFLATLEPTCAHFRGKERPLRCAFHD